MISGNNSTTNINIGSSGLYNNRNTIKTSVNKYYNIFSKKMEDMVLPNIDLEFNSPFIPEKSTFMKTA